MARELPGPHHCIGTAHAVTEIVFCCLRAQCVTGGGNLSSAEIESVYAKIIDSFPSGFDLVELRHRQCMDASVCTAETPFTRDKILAALLRACGEKSARVVFSPQIEHLGEAWIGELFDSLARYVREHLHTNINQRLIDAYIDAAMIPKIKLTFDELLKQETVQRVLIECAAAFEALADHEKTAKKVCACMNAHLARQRSVAGAHVSEITEDETRCFLSLLPQWLRTTVDHSRGLVSA